jgi:hypothetical protein
MLPIRRNIPPTRARTTRRICALNLIVGSILGVYATISFGWWNFMTWYEQCFFASYSCGLIQLGLFTLENFFFYVGRWIFVGASLTIPQYGIMLTVIMIDDGPQALWHSFEIRLLLLCLSGPALFVLTRFFAHRYIVRFVPPDGACVNCGYDLTGNLSGVCPECGWGISSGITGG